MNTKSKRRLWAALAAWVILSPTVAVTIYPGSAVAAGHRGGGGGRGGDHRGGDRRGGGWGGGGWGGGGYYGGPPVVYGSPYYAPPPVVFGVPFGLNINIR